MQWLNPLILVCALAAILGSQLGAPTALFFVLKPFTTVLILWRAWPRGEGDAARLWVRAGLLASLAGDVALLWPREGFLPGLVSFLLAHLCYLWAFTRHQRFAAWPWAFVFYGLLAGAILSQLWAGVPAALQAPVVAYVLCLSAMGAQTAVLARLSDTPRNRLLALGGLLFVVSDACLAANKFAGPLPWAAWMVLPTYWAAQWCIAGWLAPSAKESKP
ncbi:lysoplasmalogenase [Pelomonas sp. SE-A7]|uniref:lysoplasmalogenase n=1 Tax=Pelomonas sp. SE-A7 TaxID=3054953 RepID=UPI00259D1551|nr:lysoplasmalogenase [Pelomonas sp. SE-A7]MDM4768094.1 lysoplasmalogenase [Pelomonas sp. SE-A7]